MMNTSRPPEIKINCMLILLSGICRYSRVHVLAIRRRFYWCDYPPWIFTPPPSDQNSGCFFMFNVVAPSHYRISPFELGPIVEKSFAAFRRGAGLIRYVAWPVIWNVPEASFSRPGRVRVS